MPFTISISITGDEKDYTAAVQRAQQETAKLTGETEKSNQATDRQEKTAVKARAAMLPLAAGISQATQLLRQQSPAAAAAAGAIDNLAISTAAAALQTGTWRGAGAAMLGLLNPWVLAITAAGAAIAFFAGRAEAAARATEEARKVNEAFRQTMQQIAAQTSIAAAATDAQRIQAQTTAALQQEWAKLNQQYREGKVSLGEWAAQSASLGVAMEKLGATLITKSQADFIENIQQENVALATQVEKLNGGEAATIKWDAALLRAKATEEGFIAAAAAHIDKNEKLRLGILELTRTEEQRAAMAKFVAESGAALDAQETEERARNRQELDLTFKLKQQTLDLDVLRLRAAGLEDAAQKLELANLISLNEERKKALEAANISRVPGELAEITNQTTAAQIKLQQLGVVSVNVGNEAVRATTDIFSAAVNGTLKLADVGKSGLAALARVGAEFFSQMISKKLGFENILLTNMQGLPSQMAGAFQSGSAGISLGGGSTGLTAGGGGGGFLSSIGNFLSPLFSPFGGFGNFATAGLTGFGLGSIGKSFGGGINSQIFSTIGSLGGSLLGNTALGGSILTGVFDMLTAGGTAGFLGMSAGFIGELLGDFLLPGIGSLIGILMSFLMKPAAPFAKVRASVTKPFRFDAENAQFLAAKISASVSSSSGIDGGPIASQVGKALQSNVNVWTDVLNAFPEIADDAMAGTLKRATQTLRAFLSKDFKFSPGGSKGIEEEMRDFMRATAPRAAFHSLRGTIGEGLAAILQDAGFGDLAGAAQAQFSFVTPAQARAARERFTDLRTIPGFRLLSGGAGKKLDEFRQALIEFANITAGFAEVSPAGIDPFVTGEDRALIQGGLQRVLATRSATKFTPAVQRFKQDVGPVMEFLQQAVGQSQELMGRGIMAAFEAASESIAIQNFQKTVGAGIQQTVFEGLTQAFMASAQFNDLMAPVQQLIRQFTQQALETGQTPDLAAFRAALLPRIEDISTRAELLAPLIAELQKLGIDIKSALGGLTGFKAGGITIHIHGNVDSEDTVTDLLRRMGQLLQPVLGPGFQG